MVNEPKILKLFKEAKKYCQHEAEKCRYVVPLYWLALEDDSDYDSEHRQAYDFLDNFELHQAERSAIDIGPYSVGRDLQAILEESDAPREQNDQYHRPSVRNVHLLKLQMSIPRESHTYVRPYKQKNCPDNTPIHNIITF